MSKNIRLPDYVESGKTNRITVNKILCFSYKQVVIASPVLV